MNASRNINHLPRICVVGSSNIDLTFRTKRLPKAGETLHGLGFQFGYGGKGANQAIMAARLGAQVSMVSKVGRDVFGEGILRNFREHGVDIRHVQTDRSRSTGAASITVDDQARNSILVVGGANLGLTPDDVRVAASVIQSADVLLCQLEVPLESALEALKIAKTGGVRTLFNPAPAQSLADEFYNWVDVCLPNESEAEALCGERITTIAGAKKAARMLAKKGCQNVIVTLGERGAVLQQAGQIETIAATPVKAVDTSGAGDALIGSLAVFWAEGLSLADALRKANAAAGLSVTRLGTQSSFPTRAEVEEFWATVG